MMLKNKNAVIYGGGGAIGGAVARDIAAKGGVAETAQVDALDESAVETHADAMAAKSGGIDIALNAVGTTEHAAIGL